MSRDDEQMLRAERRRMAAAFDDVLHEPVPERLKALLAEPAAQVVDLGAVAVQISFKAKDGRYCRSFSTNASAGLACREADGAWALQQVASVSASGRGMRQAASSLPPSVLAAVDAAMAGEALNAEQERMARDAGWAP
ncbi:MAG: hypothetical protein EOP39_27820 [Rubrivivax sp.]|nr:MAG: hypothetical protein EOP39_27820 [Rubrivivax sp.]